MPVAVVCAAFDAAADAVIEELRAQVEATGQRVRRAHRPHLTLAAARVIDADEVVARAAEVAARHRPISLTMAGLDSFPSGVVFVRPEPSAALRELQRDAHQTLVAARLGPAFGEQGDPAQWVAHCTLATRVPARGRNRLLGKGLRPFAASVEALAVILVGGHGDVAHLPLGPQGPDGASSGHGTITA
ncbi:MAG TPA: 2'-5' RNA ligase family protein [Jatrophihabitans sp.]|jgi:2'-5' RNA ligase|nr:2'-5' RNA ligase family protein [Jatrophihabitans sp.]